MKEISKGVIKGGISVTELFIGLVSGILLNNFYSKYYQENKEQLKKNTIQSYTSIILYIFVLCSTCFVIREFNKSFITTKLKNKMNYKVFQWPEPIMFGFGMLFFQDSLKEHIKNEFEFSSINTNTYFKNSK